MGTVIYDNQTGNLVRGKVWHLLTGDDLDYLIGDLSWDKSVDIKDCPLDPRHVTGYDYEICVDLFSGDEERFAFARALSRLSEMGSQEWVERGLGMEHKGGREEMEGWQRVRSRWREDSL